MAKRRARAMRAQQALAEAFQIPAELAHTENLEKYKKWLAWLRTPGARLERFLDKLEARRKSIRE